MPLCLLNNKYGNIRSVVTSSPGPQSNETLTFSLSRHEAEFHRHTTRSVRACARAQEKYPWHETQRPTSVPPSNHQEAATGWLLLTAAPFASTPRVGCKDAIVGPGRCKRLDLVFAALTEAVPPGVGRVVGSS